MIRPTKISEIKRTWHLFDAKEKILGRLASEIAPVLIGKNKTYFTRNLDCGDNVVLVNASKITVTGKKSAEKQYLSYSGYPGGLRKETFADLKKKNPEELVKRSILNMLPNNKLRSLWIKRLHVFPESEHPYKDKFEQPKDLKTK